VFQLPEKKTRRQVPPKRRSISVCEAAFCAFEKLRLLGPTALSKYVAKVCRVHAQAYMYVREAQVPMGLLVDTVHVASCIKAGLSSGVGHVQRKAVQLAALACSECTIIQQNASGRLLDQSDAIRLRTISPTIN
jgi:hypothetical protein